MGNSIATMGARKTPIAAASGSPTSVAWTWRRIDLNEWLAMLQDAHIILTPPDQLTFEALTEGQGNRAATRLDDLRDVQTIGRVEGRARGKKISINCFPIFAGPSCFMIGERLLRVSRWPSWKTGDVGVGGSPRQVGL